MLTITSFIAPYVSSREYLDIYYETLLVKIEARHSIQGCTWDEEKAKTVEKVFSATRLRCSGKHR